MELYKNTGIKIELIDELVHMAHKYNVNKLILFGSRARGDYHRASDIDLAVYGGNIAAFALAVEEDTSTLLRYDVIDMGRKHPAKFEEAIARDGRVIYEKIR